MVVRFERVETGAGAMDLAADRMAGAMDELLGEAGAFDHPARDAVGVLAAHRFSRTYVGADEIDRGVARLGHDRKDPREFLGHSLPRHPHPRQTPVHATLTTLH